MINGSKLLNHYVIDKKTQPCYNMSMKNIALKEQFPLPPGIVSIYGHKQEQNSFSSASLEEDRLWVDWPSTESQIVVSLETQNEIWEDEEDRLIVEALIIDTEIKALREHNREIKHRKENRSR